MIPERLEQPWQDDVDSLREITAGLDRLEQQLNNARSTIKARERGYFTPDEDDRVRQMLLAYRNYRLVLYEIIHRYMDYEAIGGSVQRLRGFMVGFAAALTLYARSLKLIETYEREPLVRKKLNEPDAKFGLEAGFFEEILRAYSSLHNFSLITRAQRFWRSQRRAVKQLKLSQAPDCAWLCGVIHTQRAAVRRRFARILWHRFRYDWRVLWQTMVKPVRSATYGLQSVVGGRVAGLRTTTHYQPAIDSGVLARLRRVVQPGDVLLVRAEQKLTTALLPSFWAHAAFYVGGARDLQPFDIRGHPQVAKHWDAMLDDGGPFGCVIEAISPRALINALEKSLYADHLAVLRPNVSRNELTEALVEAFGHVGKPYDFELDFNVTSRIVCTELIYRSFHRRGGIEFTLIKRLGRFTLSGDDIANQFLDSLDLHRSGPCAPFQLVALVLKMADEKAHFFNGAPAIETMRKIRDGWRPTVALAEDEVTGVTAYG